jgi:hypothetical protein
MQEWAEHEGLMKAYQEWCAEGEILANPGCGGDPEEE